MENKKAKEMTLENTLEVVVLHLVTLVNMEVRGSTVYISQNGVGFIHFVIFFLTIVIIFLIILFVIFYLIISIVIIVILLDVWIPLLVLLISVFIVIHRRGVGGNIDLNGLHQKIVKQ